ncbi:MAG: hypothetical protein Q4B29_02195 [Candidatus Saccharibacteria bacterium]|nr:hypothetical protein [Candidatus Saccharibacteria bacterium]
MQAVKQTKGMGFSYTLMKDEETGKLVTLMRADGRTWNVGNRVHVGAGTNNQVCEGIRAQGFGYITEIRDDDSGRWLGVKMDDGDFGFVKMTLVTLCDPPVVLAI